LKIILIPIIVVLFDQLSKVLVKKYFIHEQLFYSNINILGDFLRFTFIENPGIAFGIDTSNYHIYITILTILAIVFIYYQLSISINNNNSDMFPLAFILGGAIGNCIDRILIFIPYFNYNGVIDFIDIGIKNFRWYVFNIADASISIGLFIFLYNFFMIKTNKSIEKNI
jgi:signal peptidase II|tara:strand:- start:6422 stop:6928 length:507 start_codon:yes stop_codon:yes gene_type:complete